MGIKAAGPPPPPVTQLVRGPTCWCTKKLRAEKWTQVSLGWRGEQPLIAEVGLEVWAVTPWETRLELAVGHLLARALWFPNEPGLPGEPGALSWETVRTLHLLANVVKRITS